MKKKRNKIITFALIFLLTLGLSGVGKINAYYDDTETSGGNSFSASSLDFSLTSAANFSPVVTPTTDTIRAVAVNNDGSLGFDYSVKTANPVGDLCPVLDLTASLDGGAGVTEPLNTFDIGPFTFGAPENWDFTASLNDDDASYQGKTCTFDIVFDGEQSGGAGFSDTETLASLVTAGEWVAPTEPGDDNISPIADSYIDQDNEDDNNGNDSDLKVRSQSGGKNKRAFIRFGFLFPAGTTIESAVMKLFLDDAPSSSRTYAVARSLSSWTETGITWNNQPITSSPITDSLSTGTINDVWLSWDVEDDVAGFVAGTFSNYGWGLFDTEENLATSREGKFGSRNENNESKRPVLEVAFSALPATTTHLVVNEVYYDVGDGKGSEGTNEWVEIYNPTSVAVDISGWEICDSGSCDVIPASTPVPAYGFAVITPNASTWTEWTPFPAGAIQIVLSGGSLIGGGLSDSGDAVILKNASSVEIDAMSYGSNTSKLSPAVSDGPEGTSATRIVKGYDADLATDWIINATPNPGTNPSDSGIEIMRFTDRGVEVADYATGLDPLFVGDPSPAEEIIIEPIPEITLMEELREKILGLLPDFSPDIIADTATTEDSGGGGAEPEIMLIVSELESILPEEETVIPELELIPLVEEVVPEEEVSVETVVEEETPVAIEETPVVVEESAPVEPEPQPEADQPSAEAPESESAPEGETP